MKTERKKELMQSTKLSEPQIDELINNPYELKNFNGTDFIFYEEGEDCIFEFDGEPQISVDEVIFSSLEEVFSIYKNNLEYTLKNALDDFVDIFDEEEHKRNFGAFAFDRDFVTKTWNETTVMTAKEALNYDNMEQRMVALRYVGAEAMIKELGAELLDEQTICKKQEELVYLGEGKPSPVDRNPKNFETHTKEYNDTYKLYRIKSDKIIKESSRNSIDAEYIYICGMKDTSTDREYYIFVSPDVGKGEDAINAIASTLRIVNGDGKPSSPLSKKDYFALRSET